MPADGRSESETFEAVDLDRASAARIYDWYLGGENNWAIDREFGRKMLRQWPHAKHGSRHNRQFMQRAVRAALDAGIRQFLDLGSGIPTAGNVHEIVADYLPADESAAVVYVDYEPVAAAHARMILEQQDAGGWAALAQHDMRYPGSVLADAHTQRLIDFTQPVCVLMLAVLHFVTPDDNPTDIIGSYLDRLSPGSWLALSHMTVPDEAASADGVTDFAARYRDTADPVWLRDRAEIGSFFTGLTLLEPGIVHLTDWRPAADRMPLSAEAAQARPYAWCGVAEKPTVR